MKTTSAPVSPKMTVGPDDPRYTALSTGFNQRFVGKPAYIQLCATTEEVRIAVQAAMDAGKRITIRGGGHCYEGFVSDNPGGVIIDLSPMKSVYRDATMGNAYCAEAGCVLWDVYPALYKLFGVTVPGGSCYSVGVGGNVCGGGYGLLSRLHGLASDHLAAVEVVCVDGNGTASVVVARKGDTNRDKRDLFWAHTGGGGGNFGVITRYWFAADLPQAPRNAYLGVLAWNWSDMTQDHFTQLLESYGNFFAEHSQPGDYGELFTLMHLTQNLPGAQIIVEMQCAGEDSKPIDDFIGAMQLPIPAVRQTASLPTRPVFSHEGDYRQMPWIEATQNLNASGHNQRGKYKSAYMKKPFPRRQIDAIWNALSKPLFANSQALLQVDSYGGQINAVKPGDTAAAQRSSIMKLQYQIYWTDPAQDDLNIDWLRWFYESVYADTGGVPVSNDVTDGCFVNYCDVDLKDWRTLYYKDGYPKLMQIKQKWDPLNVFNHAQSIELPKSGGAARGR